MLATVLLLTTLPIVVGGGLVAGNLMLDLNARNDILYEQLRQSLSIDILEDVFSNNEKVPPPLTMHTADGERYVCSLPDLDGFDENDDDTASSSNDAASATAVHPAERMESIMKTLEGRCDTLNVGWWSYEWCHRRHVRQFHVDHASGKVDPVWSLGHYTRTDLKISATTDSASSSGDASSDPPAYPPTPPQPAASVVTSVVDLFEAGGQHCDEIGKGRQTRIEFRCCTDASSPVDASPAPSSSRSLVAAAAAAAAMAAAVDPNDNSRTAQRKRKNAALTAAAAAAAAAAFAATFSLGQHVRHVAFTCRPFPAPLLGRLVFVHDLPARRVLHFFPTSWERRHHGARRLWETARRSTFGPLPRGLVGHLVPIIRVAFSTWHLLPIRWKGSGPATTAAATFRVLGGTFLLRAEGLLLPQELLLENFGFVLLLLLLLRVPFRDHL